MFYYFLQFFYAALTMSGRFHANTPPCPYPSHVPQEEESTIVGLGRVSNGIPDQLRYLQTIQRVYLRTVVDWLAAVRALKPTSAADQRLLNSAINTLSGIERQFVHMEPLLSVALDPRYNDVWRRIPSASLRSAQDFNVTVFGGGLDKLRTCAKLDSAILQSAAPRTEMLRSIAYSTGPISCGFCSKLPRAQHSQNCPFVRLFVRVESEGISRVMLDELHNLRACINHLLGEVSDQ